MPCSTISIANRSEAGKASDAVRVCVHNMAQVASEAAESSDPRVWRLAFELLRRVIGTLERLMAP
jgi:hypothetical protein